MFLRFIGVSDEFLNAAGPAATIPSRIGSEREAVLGSTHPNGTALGDTLANSDSSLDPEKLIGSDGTLLGGKGATEGMTGSAIEGLVNASSAIVLVFIMLIALGGFLFFRRRYGSRNKFTRREGGWGALGGVTGGGSRGKHSRVESLGRGGGMGLGGVAGESTEEEEQELDELMKSRRRAEIEEDEEDRIEGKGKGKGKGKSRIGNESEIFDLGAEEDDEEEQEAERRRYGG